MLTSLELLLRVLNAYSALGRVEVLDDLGRGVDSAAEDDSSDETLLASVMHQTQHVICDRVVHLHSFRRVLIKGGVYYAKRK